MNSSILNTIGFGTRVKVKQIIYKNYSAPWLQSGITGTIVGTVPTRRKGVVRYEIRFYFPSKGIDKIIKLYSDEIEEVSSSSNLFSGSEDFCMANLVMDNNNCNCNGGFQNPIIQRFFVNSKNNIESDFNKKIDAIKESDFNYKKTLNIFEQISTMNNVPIEKIYISVDNSKFDLTDLLGEKSTSTIRNLLKLKENKLKDLCSLCNDADACCQCAATFEDIQKILLGYKILQSDLTISTEYGKEL